MARIRCLSRPAQACEGANDNNPSAEIYYLHTDHLGRPKAATNTSGEIVWDGGMTTPFGQGVTTMGAITQKLMFPGQYEDTETGYAHNWHRTYDPTLGRYLQADPIGLTGGLNRYAYVGGNPTGWVDPSGLTDWRHLQAWNNAQHNRAVRHWRQQDAANGWEVSDGVVSVRFPDGRLRMYDYSITGSGITYGVEVKTTRRQILNYKKKQFSCDLEIASSPIGMFALNRQLISGVAYRGATFGPGDGIDKILSDSRLKKALRDNNMDYQVQPVPGIFTK